LTRDTSFLLSGDVGEVLIGAGNGVIPTWSTELTTLTKLTVDSITINAAVISSATGAVSFDNDDIVTTGDVYATGIAAVGALFGDDLAIVAGIIASVSGTISFDDDNITTTGTVSGVNVTSGVDPGHTHTAGSITESDPVFVASAACDITADDITNWDTAYGWGDHSEEGYCVATRSAVAYEDIDAGEVIYIRLDGLAALVAANSEHANKIAGVAVTSATSGNNVSFIVIGPIELANWTAIAGEAALTIGTIYYLKETVEPGPENVPSYDNDGGTDDRTGIIVVSTTMSYNGTLSKLVDGVKTLVADSVWWSGTVDDKYLRFDFGIGESKQITEAKWYQSTTDSHGTWKWQGSDDAVSWSDIGASFTLGGATTQTQTTLSENGIGYRYYQLYGVSGSASVSPYIYEIEFEIADFLPTTSGKITSTAPTTDGSYVIQVGRALTTTVLNVNIAQSILL
jgi:hypothetical protein